MPARPSALLPGFFDKPATIARLMEILRQRQVERESIDPSDPSYVGRMMELLNPDPRSWDEPGRPATAPKDISPLQHPYGPQPVDVAYDPVEDGGEDVPFSDVRTIVEAGRPPSPDDPRDLQIIDALEGLYDQVSRAAPGRPVAIPPNNLLAGPYVSARMIGSGLMSLSDANGEENVVTFDQPGRR